MDGKVMQARRDDFPILCGNKISYLDTAASAQKPQVVIDAMTHVMQTHYANIHRGLYGFSQDTTAAFEAAREKIARFIGASSAQEIVFTRNATESINLVAASWGGKFLENGDEIILSEMEHHANIVPWQLLSDSKCIEIKVTAIHEDGSLDVESLQKLLSTRTKLVSLVHISNAIGTINNIKKIIEIIKNFNPKIKVLIDGSQAVVHSPVNISDLGCDFYVFTGHKLYAPTGIGVLWGRAEILETMPPYQGGGDMIERVTFERTTYKTPPARFEAGTPAIIEAIGLGAAVDYLTDIGMENVAAHETELLGYAMERLSDIDGLRFYGTTEQKAGIISFTADWGHPSDIGTILDQCGVAVRVGHHCCMPLMQRLGIDGTVRASFGVYTTEDDIDALVRGLEKARGLLT